METNAKSSKALALPAWSEPNIAGDAVKIINLPEELDTDLTHRYEEMDSGCFVYRHRRNSVVGILGANGMGKQPQSIFSRVH